MRTVFLLMNVSLDGYIADANNDTSSFTNDFAAFDAGGHAVDTLLFGRKTYEMMKFWATPQALEIHAGVAKFMNETPKLVVSHQAFDPGWQNVMVIHENVIPTIQRIKAQDGQSIGIFGSNNLCVSLLPTGVIDELHIIVNPIVLGDGPVLFDGLSEKANFQLTATTPFESGSVMLTYIPKIASAK